MIRESCESYSSVTFGQYSRSPHWILEAVRVRCLMILCLPEVAASIMPTPAQSVKCPEFRNLHIDITHVSFIIELDLDQFSTVSVSKSCANNALPFIFFLHLALDAPQSSCSLHRRFNYETKEALFCFTLKRSRCRRTMASAGFSL
jgi:hypothetical protein